MDQLSKIHNILGTPSPKLISKLSIHKSCNLQQFPKQTGTGLLPLLTNISSDGQDILKQMLIYDPDMRSNVKRLLEHRYFINYRDHSDKVLQRRVSFTEPSKTAAVGDWRSSSILKPPPSHKNNDKYITSANRASQNNVIDIKKFCTSNVTTKSSQVGTDRKTVESSTDEQKYLKSTSLQTNLR